MFVLLVKDVFSTEECAKLVSLSEEAGYVPAVIHKADGRVVYDKSHRDSDRVMIDDPALALELFTRLQAHLPQNYHGRALIGINERLRYLRYGEGQRFRLHSDGCYVTPDETQRSFLTLQLYLCDVEQGGETILYEDDDVDKEKFRVSCRTGQVLLFDHDVFHEGAAVVKGLKYCIRTDVMYDV